MELEDINCTLHYFLIIFRMTVIQQLQLFLASHNQSINILLQFQICLLLTSCYGFATRNVSLHSRGILQVQLSNVFGYR